MRRELICTDWAVPSRLDTRTSEVPSPAAGQVLVRVQACSVNPIDAKRAGGYGRRLLALKGAATLPVVLGNDLAGVVEAVGAGVSGWSTGQRVLGLVATGRGGGAHASHVLVPPQQLVPVSDDAQPAALAVLPYSFTTMWLALRATGLDASNAAGARVLVHGANGGLGRLALQLLQAWRSRVTAICGRGAVDECLALGAEMAIEHGPGAIASLPAHFQVVLNFASWDDDPLLASRLNADALGHATTVHPLLGHIDRFGWLQGALASLRDWKKVRSVVAERAPNAHYAWTVFKPDGKALEALAVGACGQPFSLPVGLSVPLDEGAAAFEHVAAGKAGRVVLLP